MSDTQYQEAFNEAKKLTDLSDEALFEQLGLRIQDMQNVGGYQRSQQYSAEFAQEAEDMWGMEDLKKIGRRWWEKLEPELMKLVCDEKNEDMKQITSGKTLPQVAASLATVAVVSAWAAPAWIIVATSILAAKIADTGLDALCETWQESLEQGEEEEQEI